MGTKETRKVCVVTPGESFGNTPVDLPISRAKERGGGACGREMVQELGGVKGSSGLDYFVPLAVDIRVRLRFEEGDRRVHCLWKFDTTLTPNRPPRSHPMAPA